MSFVRTSTWLAMFFLVFAWPSMAQQGESVERNAPDDFSALPLEPIDALGRDDNDDTVPDRSGEWARVQGVVTLEPGVLGQEFFQTVIQDETGGVFIFSYDLNEPLSMGQRVEVAGRISQYNGILQLQSIVILDAQQADEVPAPRLASMRDLNGRKHFGERVQVVGEVIETDINRHALIRLRGDDDANINLFVPETRVALLPWPRLSKGSRIEASGIASLHDRAWPYNAGWQVVVSEPQNIALLKAPDPSWWIWVKWALFTGMVLSGIFFALLLFFSRRRRQRERETNTLNALSAALGVSNLSSAQLAERACTNLCQFGLFDVAALHGFDEYGHLHLLAVSEKDPKLTAILDYGRIRQGDDQTQVVFSPQEQEHLGQRMSQLGLYLANVRSLDGRNQTIGFLSVFSRSSARLSFGQTRVLSSAAKLIALGLEHIAEQNRSENERARLNALANTDALTGLYNRRFLEDYLRIQSALARRRNGGLSFFALDIDHFKSLNDTYGHDVGDATLVKLADILQQATRASDLVVRQGGEEFLIVSAESDGEGARDFAERLRHQVETADFTSCGVGESTPVTVSIGVAHFPRDGDTTREAIRASDDALYRAKNEGRNCVRISNNAT